MNKYRVVGIMSGTSLDGVDIALCVFARSRGKWNFEIESAETIGYTPQQRKELASLGQASAVDFAKAHVDYGRQLGNFVNAFLKKRKCNADFVASHGHTVFHQPQKGFTTQIGDGAALSAACRLPVVCDFRSVDIALGGQGAPLVPIGDQFLFGAYSACLNLGGIANISYERSGNRIAFDVCPVNLVLNYFAGKMGREYDKGGELARSGMVQEKLLKKLNAVPFYKKKFPKSLGREDIEKYFLPLMEQDNHAPQDILKTFCEHIAIQVSAVEREMKQKSGTILVSGGGTYHTFLMERMKAHCRMDLVIPESRIIEFKEALIFAFLGVLRWRNEVNCLRSVTGAIRNSSGGAVYHP